MADHPDARTKRKRSDGKEDEDADGKKHRSSDGLKRRSRSDRDEDGKPRDVKPSDKEGRTESEHDKVSRGRDWGGEDKGVQGPSVAEVKKERGDNSEKSMAGTDVQEKRKEREVEGGSVPKVSKRRRWDQEEGKQEETGDLTAVKNSSKVAANGAGAVPVATNGHKPGSQGVAAGSATAGLGSSAAAAGPGSGKPAKPNLTLGALEKARKALQMQKELSAKLAKLPQLKKSSDPAASAASGAAIPKPTLPAAAGVGMAGMPGPQAATSAAASQPQPATSAAVPPAPALTAGLPGPFAGFMPGFMPGMPGMPGMMSGMMPGMMSGMMPGMMPSLDMMLKAQQAMAQQLGLQIPGARVEAAAGKAAEPAEPKPAKPPVLRLDAQGREIDEHGNVIEKGKKQGPVSTLKVNINKAKKEAFKILRPELEEDPIDSPFFDSRMGTNKTKLVRARKASLSFVPEGEMAKRAEMQRLRAQVGEARLAEIRARQEALARAKAEQEKEVNPNLISVGERVPVEEPKQPKDPIPDTEWWDASLLVHGKYGVDVEEGQPVNVKTGKITIYVEHPVPIEPPAEAPPPPPQPLKLTKKEQKKLRTQRRLAREKERQEMIRQGLLEPPKAKVKMSNLMKVLAAEATQDPTRMEQQVKSAAAEREQAHVDRNLARKLTPAEKREKRERKLFDDPNTVETLVSVYRLVHLAHPQTRFKVDINVQENRLTGRCIMADSMTIVIVEGGAKSIKRFSKLMLRRINWESAVVEAKEADPRNLPGGSRPNECKLVWQGAVASPTFEDFRIEQFRTSVAAKKHLEDNGCAHYWDLAHNFPED